MDSFKVIKHIVKLLCLAVVLASVSACYVGAGSYRGYYPRNNAYYSDIDRHLDHGRYDTRRAYYAKNRAYYKHPIYQRPYHNKPHVNGANNHRPSVNRPYVRHPSTTRSNIQRPHGNRSHMGASFNRPQRPSAYHRPSRMGHR